MENQLLRNRYLLLWIKIFSFYQLEVCVLLVLNLMFHNSLLVELAFAAQLNWLCCRHHILDWVS